MRIIGPGDREGGFVCDAVPEGDVIGGFKVTEVFSDVFFGQHGEGVGGRTTPAAGTTAGILFSGKNK